MAIKINNVYKSFDSHNQENVIEDLNLDIEDGELICILGPSGCGKTTLIRMIAGLELPSSGEILEDDIPITKPDKKRGLISQQYSLFPWRTVFDNVAFGLEVNNVPKEEKKYRVEKFLDSVGLIEYKDHYPKELSGGMKQRVAIIRTIINDTKTMLMDEPFSALDVQNKHKLHDELIRYWKKSKRTIIFVTHDVEEAIYLSDRIVILSKQPSNIVKIFNIDLPHPRNRKSPEFIDLEEEILEIVDIQKI